MIYFFRIEFGDLFSFSFYLVIVILKKYTSIELMLNFAKKLLVLLFKKIKNKRTKIESKYKMQPLMSRYVHSALF
jgi:hypothetical protein